MNKTININLGGTFFHIDENAYNHLSSYLEAVRATLSPEDSIRTRSNLVYLWGKHVLCDIL